MTSIHAAPRRIAGWSEARQHGVMVLRSIFRRRLTVAILVLLPIAFYLATYDALGRSVRALVFGISWAVSTVAFFAASSAREVEPRLRLAGFTRPMLLMARIGALWVLAWGLAAVFWVMVSVDRPVRSPSAVAVDFAVTGLVAVAFGTAIGALIRGELEGTLVLFFFAGLQAVLDPFDPLTRLLPFWSSRELGTYAIDGPAQGSLSSGLLHASATIAACVLAAAVAGPLAQRVRRPSPPGS